MEKMRTVGLTILWVLMLCTLLGAQPPTPTLLRVTRETQERQLLRRVEPMYPEVARARHIRGIVTLEILIDVEGRVRNARVISGHPLLTQAALDAVRQWVYRPTTFNNAPAEVVTSDYVVFPPPAPSKPRRPSVTPQE